MRASVAPHVSSLLLLLGWAALPTCSAMKGALSETLNSPFIYKWSEFGYYAGGELSLNVSIRDNHLHTQHRSGSNHSNFTYAGWVLVCTTDEVESFLDLQWTSHDLCYELGNPNASAPYAGCHYGGMLGALSSTSTEPPDEVHTWSIDTLVDEEAQYFFLACACGTPFAPPAHAVLDINYHFMNPGGEELSSGAVPLKPLTLAACGVWGAAVGLLLLNMAAARLFAKSPALPVSPEEAAALGRAVLSPVRALHWALAMLGALQAVAAAVASLYWTQLSLTGEDNFQFNMGQLLLAGLAFGGVTWVILALSRGWQITRLSLPSPEAWQNASLAALQLAVWTLWAADGGLVSLFVLLLVSVLTVRYLLATSTWTLALLDTLRGYVAVLVNTLPVAGGGAISASGEASAPPPPPATEPGLVIARSSSNSSSGSGGRVSGSTAGVVGGSSRRGSLSRTPLLSPATGAPSPRPGAGSTATSAAAAATAGASPRAFALPSMSASTSVATTPPPARRSWRSRVPRPLLIALGLYSSDSTGAAAGSPFGSLTQRQIRVIRSLRTVSLTFVTLNLVVQVWVSFSLESRPWVAYMLAQAMALALCAYIGVVFRARADVTAGPLFDPRGYVPGGESLEAMLLRRREYMLQRDSTGGGALADLLSRDSRRGGGGGSRYSTDSEDEEGGNYYGIEDDDAAAAAAAAARRRRGGNRSDDSAYAAHGSPGPSDDEVDDAVVSRALAESRAKTPRGDASAEERGWGRLPPPPPSSSSSGGGKAPSTAARGSNAGRAGAGQQPRVVIIVNPDSEDNPALGVPVRRQSTRQQQPPAQQWVLEQSAAEGDDEVASAIGTIATMSGQPRRDSAIPRSASVDAQQQQQPDFTQPPSADQRLQQPPTG